MHLGNRGYNFGMRLKHLLMLTFTDKKREEQYSAYKMRFPCSLEYKTLSSKTLWLNIVICAWMESMADDTFS